MGLMMINIFILSVIAINGTKVEHHIVLPYKTEARCNDGIILAKEIIRKKYDQLIIVCNKEPVIDQYD